jgi:hypothetical protein
MVRLREGQYIVPDYIIFMPLHSEQFLARFNVVVQRAVCEAEPPRLIHNVCDPASIQGPQTASASQNAHDLFGFNGRVRPAWFRPAEAKLFPLVKGIFGGGKGSLASAELNACVVYNVADRRSGSGRPDRRISEGELRLFFEEGTDQ